MPTRDQDPTKVLLRASDSPYARTLRDALRKATLTVAFLRRRLDHYRAYARELEADQKDPGRDEGARVEELKAALASEKREHKGTQEVLDGMGERALVVLEGLPERDGTECWHVHRALSALERLKSETRPVYAGPCADETEQLDALGQDATRLHLWVQARVPSLGASPEEFTALAQIRRIVDAFSRLKRGLTPA